MNLASGKKPSFLPSELVTMTEIAVHNGTEIFKCFLCDRIFTDKNVSLPMFEKRCPANAGTDYSLAAILSTALGRVLEQNTVHSEALCEECNFILLEFHNIEQKLYQFRLQIISDYNKTAKANGLEPIWFQIQNVEAAAQIYSQQPVDGHMFNTNEIKTEIVDNREQDAENTTHVQENATDIGESSITKPALSQLGFNNAQVANLESPNMQKPSHNSPLKKYECSECHKKYLSLNLLDEHMNMHVGQRPYECMLCGKNFASKYTLKTHMRIHTKKDMSNKCRKHEGLARRKHTELNSIQTSDTPKQKHPGGGVLTRGQMSRGAFRLDPITNMYNCTLCPQKSECEPILFANHLKDVHNYEFYVCSICYQGFRKQIEINDHMTKVHHEGEKTKVECKSCCKVLENHLLFRPHARDLFSSLKKHSCTICSKKFLHKQSLDLHMNVHLGKDPYKCVFCRKAFKSKYFLKTHVQEKHQYYG